MRFSTSTDTKQKSYEAMQISVGSSHLMGVGSLLDPPMVVVLLVSFESHNKGYPQRQTRPSGGRLWGCFRGTPKRNSTHRGCSQSESEHLRSSLPEMDCSMTQGRKFGVFQSTGTQNGWSPLVFLLKLHKGSLEKDTPIWCVVLWVSCINQRGSVR